MTSLFRAQSSADPRQHTVLVSPLAHGAMSRPRYHTLRDVKLGKARYGDRAAPNEPWQSWCICGAVLQLLGPGQSRAGRDRSCAAVTVAGRP